MFSPALLPRIAAPFFAALSLIFAAFVPSTSATLAAKPASRLHSAGVPRVAGVVVVIMENRDYSLVIGNSQAPYINGTLVPQAALLTNSHGVSHPSQPNYLALFSGSTQGISDDSCPHNFSSGNLGAEILAAGQTFYGYSESMPSDGYTACTYGSVYARKHNPWVDFTNVPSTSNLIYYDMPRAAKKKHGSVAIIVPNLCNDMHNCSTQTGDNWLKANLPSILQYDAANNGLLILTWDEADPDSNGSNQVATLLIGPMVAPGQYNQNVNHYNILRTIEKVTGVGCIANECKTPPLKGIWL